MVEQGSAAVQPDGEPVPAGAVRGASVETTRLISDAGTALGRVTERRSTGVRPQAADAALGSRYSCVSGESAARSTDDSEMKKSRRSQERHHGTHRV